MADDNNIEQEEHNLELETAEVGLRLNDNAAIRGAELKTLRDAVVNDFQRSYQVLETVSHNSTAGIRENHGLILGHIRNHPGAAALQAPQAPPSVNVLGSIGSPSLSYFSGAPGSDFTSWSRTFQDALNAPNPPINDDNRRALLLAYLRDAARDKAADIIDDNNAATFQQVLTELSAAFTNTQQAELSRQQLRSARQDAVESVDDFAIRIRRLARSAYPTYDRATQDACMKEAFLDGIRYDIKFHCKANRPQSFTEALMSALHFESLLAECARAQTVNPAQISTIHLPTGPVRQFNNNHSFSRNQQNYQHSPAQHRPNQRNWNSPRRQNRSQPPVCHNCKYLGHYQRYCPFLSPQFTQSQNPVRNHAQRQPLPTQMSVQVRDNNNQADLSQQLEALRIRNQQLSDIAYGNEQRHVPRINIFRPSLPFLLIFAILASCMSPAHALTPLLCNPHAPTQLWRLPQGIDCSFDPESAIGAPQPLTLSIYRPNTMQYESAGYLCKVVRQSFHYSVSFWGFRDSSTDLQHVTVSREACNMMINHKQCDFGSLTPSNGIWKTSNTLSIDWPSAPFSVFAGTKTASVTNCVLVPSTIRSRFDQQYPESTTANLHGCNFTAGFCNLREGDAVTWEPSVQQLCRFIPFSTQKGTRTGSLWISKNNELALSWNSSSPVTKSCNEKLAITDQGFAIGAAQSRSKRSTNTDVGLVTSNQLAAQLLALETSQRHFSSVMYAHSAHALCDAFNNYVQLTLESMTTNPVLAMRKLLNQTNIKATYLGNGYALTSACVPLPPHLYNWSAFRDNECYTKPRITINIPGASPMESFVDPLTMIVSDRAHSINCNHTANFMLHSEEDFFELDPLSGTVSKISIQPQELSFRKIHFEANSSSATIIHNLIIGDISEFQQSSGITEMWSSIEGNDAVLAEAVARSAHPSEGPSSLIPKLEIPSLWATIFGSWTIFDIWVLLCCMFSSAKIICFLIKLALRIYAPQLFLAADSITSPLTSPRTPRPNSVNLSYLYNSHQVNNLTVDAPYFVAQVPVSINGIKILALIDTGASITVASKDLCPLLGIFKLDMPVTTAAIGVGGSPIAIAGRASASISIGSTKLDHSIHFTSQRCTPTGPENYEIIFGNDLLRRLPAFQLDYANGAFHCAGSSIPLGRQLNCCTISELNVDIRVAQETVIPPASEGFVKCYAEGPVTTPYLVLTTQRSSPATSDIIVTPAVISAATPTILLTNPTNQPKKVYKGMRLAYAEAFADEKQCF